MPQQHDHDQQRELPPEVELVIQQPEARAPGGEERDGDRQGDQQHHPRTPALQLTDGTREERAATPHVHQRSEHGRDPCEGGDVRKRVAEDHREHPTGADDRDCEDQHDPEQSPELRDVIPVPTAMPRMAVTACRAVVLVRRTASGCVLLARHRGLVLILRLHGGRARSLIVHAAEYIPPWGIAIPPWGTLAEPLVRRCPLAQVAVASSRQVGVNTYRPGGVGITIG